MTSLRWRLLVLYSGLMTGAVALILWGAFTFAQRHRVRQLDAALESHFEAIQYLLQVAPHPYNRHNVAPVLTPYVQQHAAQRLYVQIHTATDWELFHSDNLGETYLPDLTGKLTVEPRTRERRVNLGAIRVGENYHENLHVQLALPLDDVLALKRQHRALLVWGLPSVLLASLLAGYLISKSSLHALCVMQDAARKITASNLSERIPVPRGSAEFRELALLLNEMFDRLEHAFYQLQRFTADTSHEVRRPLTIIRIHAERLLYGFDLPEDAQAVVEEQLQEIYRVDDVLERLLVLAQAEGKTLPLRRQSAPTQDFVAEFALDAQALSEEHQLEFRVLQNQDGDVCFDATWIRQVLLNVVHNAIKASPPDGAIDLTSILGADWWRIEIQDEGPGIPPDRLPHIFDRFVQVAPQSERRSGSGLGLAICKSLVELHGGDIRGENRATGGFVVRIVLPRRC